MSKSIFAALIPKGSVDYIALWLLAWSCVHCGSLPPKVVPVGVATVETAICVLNTFSKDKAHGMSDGDSVADCITQCATDAATIARVLDAHKAAEVREMVTK